MKLFLHKLYDIKIINFRAGYIAVALMLLSLPVFSGNRTYSEIIKTVSAENYLPSQNSASDKPSNVASEPELNSYLAGTTMTITVGTTNLCNGSSTTVTYSWSLGDGLQGYAQYSLDNVNWYNMNAGPLATISSGVAKSISPTAATTYYGRVMGNLNVLQYTATAQTVNVLPTPGTTTVSGAGTFCSSATLTASHPSAGTITLGTGTATTAYSPLYGFYNYSRTMSIILASELSNSRGKITHLAVYVGTAGSHAFTGIQIRLKETTATTAPTTWDGTGTLVWSGSYTFNTVGWVTFDITDFNWVNNNLLIAWQHGFTAYTSNYPYFAYTTQSSNLQSYGYSDSALPTSFTATTTRPNYRLTFANTIYWENTTSNGTSTATPSSSQAVTGTGTYYFRTRSSDGCWGAQGSAAVTIQIPPTDPTGFTNQGTTICQGNSITLTATGGTAGSGCTYQWYAGGCGTGSVLGTGSSLVVTPTSTTTYFVRRVGTTTCTNTTGCASGTIYVNTPPTAPTGVSGSTTICNGYGTSVILTATGGDIGSGCTYQWYAGGCGSGSVLGTGSSITVSPTTTTTYFVRRVGTTPCNSIVTSCASGVVTVNQPPTAPTGVSGGTAICNGYATNVTLTATGGNEGSGCTYQWYAGGCGNGSVLGTGSSMVVSPTTTTTYYVRRVGTAPCNSTVTLCASGTITVNEQPTAPTGINNAGTTICTGGSVTLTATGGSEGSGCTYQWYADGCGSGSVLGTGSSISVSPTATTTYYVRRVGTTSCTNTTACFSGVVNVVADPVAQNVLGSPVSGTDICLGGSVSATFSGGSGGTGTITNNYQYSTNGGGTWLSYTPDNDVTSVSTGANRVQIRTWRSATGEGCDNSSYNTAQWTVVDDPAISISGVTTSCTGETVLLSSNASGGTGTLTYQWQYNIGSNWINTGTNNNEITTIPILQTTQYRCIYSGSGQGCTNAISNTHTITINNNLLVTLDASDDFVCDGGESLITTQISPAGQYAYQWQYKIAGFWRNAVGFTESTLLSHPPYTREYRVLATPINSNCYAKYSSPITITVFQDPTITVQPLDRNICTGGTHTMTVTAIGGITGLNYQWQISDDSNSWLNIANETESSLTISNVTLTKYYRCMVSAVGSGCTTVFSEPALVAVYDDPAVQIGQDYEYCVGESAFLILTSISGGCGVKSYQWQFYDGEFWRDIEGETNYKTTLTPTVPTQYRLAYAAHGNGCTTAYSNAILVNVHPDPYFVEQPVGGNIATPGEEFPVDVQAAGGVSLIYQWQYFINEVWTDIPGANSPDLITKAPFTRNYRVKISSDGLGCNDNYSNIITITVGSGKDNPVDNPADSEFTLRILPDVLIYPNPFNNQIYMRFSNLEEGELCIDIFDLYGRLILRDKELVTAGIYYKEINLSSLSTGMYFVRMSNGNNIITKKIEKHE